MEDTDRALLVKLGWSKASNQDKVYVKILIAKNF